MSADPKAKVVDPPSFTPETPSDPTDKDVSLFGSHIAFDGLGVVFDTMPTQPLLPRSDRRNWDTNSDIHRGLGVNGGVVSGILDDGTGGWLEPDSRVMKGSDEAFYLEKAFGECEGMSRPANH